MEINGGGMNGDKRTEGEWSLGMFRVEARQLRSFYVLTCAFTVLIIAFMAWESAASGEAKTWHAIVAGVIEGFIWRLLTGGAMAIMAINAWEAIMGQINPLAIMGTGKGPKWWRSRVEYANERVAEATAVAEREKAEAVAAAEARGREIGRREAEEAFKNGDLAVEDVYC